MTGKRIVFCMFLVSIMALTACSNPASADSSSQTVSTTSAAQQETTQHGGGIPVASPTTSPKRIPDDFHFTQIAVGAWSRVVALDSEGRLWETNPEKGSKARIYAGNPM